MPRKVITRTGKAGASVNDRRILEAVDATTSAPSAITDGFLLDRNEFIHFLFKLTGSVTFTVQLWWYSPISGTWHKGEELTIDANSVTTVEVQGLERVALQVTGVTGTGTISAWLALVIPV